MKRAADDTGIIEVVARNVRTARKAARLSQEELAHEAKVDRTYVSQVERRLRNVTITVLARLAKALGTTPDKLLATTTVPTAKRTARQR
jgi:transcriptional regulator with XRE-family HTH domain